MPEFTWLPANRAATNDVEAVFATGGARKCRCQSAKVPGWIWRDTNQEERDAALLAQTACGTDGPTSGLIGYVDGEAAGWVAVEPRENYADCGAGSSRGCGWTPNSRASGQSRFSLYARAIARQG